MQFSTSRAVILALALQAAPASPSISPPGPCPRATFSTLGPRTRETTSTPSTCSPLPTLRPHPALHPSPSAPRRCSRSRRRSRTKLQLSRGLRRLPRGSVGTHTSRRTFLPAPSRRWCPKPPTLSTAITFAAAATRRPLGRRISVPTAVAGTAAGAGIAEAAAATTWTDGASVPPSRVARRSRSGSLSSPPSSRACSSSASSRTGSGSAASWSAKALFASAQSAGFSFRYGSSASPASRLLEPPRIRLV